MEKIVGFFLGSNGTLIMFAFAFGAGMWARSLANKGKIAQATKLAWVAMISACMLVVSYLAVAVLAHSPVTLLFSALWGYFAWRDWKMIKQLQGTRGR